MEIILAVIYLLSPVPLLIFALAERSAKKRAQEEVKFLKLQLKKRSVQPDIREDVPVVAVSDGMNEAAPESDQAQNPVVGSIPKTPGPAETKPYSIPEDMRSIYVNPVLPLIFRVPDEKPDSEAAQHKTPAPMPQDVTASGRQDITVSESDRPNVAAFQSNRPDATFSRSDRPKVTVPKKDTPAPADWSPAPANPVNAGRASEFSENRSLISILVVGVILVLLALVGFISATWSNLSVGARAAWLFSFSFILLATGIFARAKLNLTNTSIALYSIGSAALPITIIGSAAFKLFGSYFTLEYPHVYDTVILALVGLFVLLAFGAVFFESRVFAAGSLTAISVILFCIALQNNDNPYRLNVLLIAVFAALVTVFVPLVKRIPEFTVFRSFADIYETYSVINLYAMSVIALFLSGNNRYAGLFLIVLGIVFLHVTVLTKQNGHLSLPSCVLFLIGTGLLIRPSSLLNAIIWMLVVSFCTLALSVIFKKIRILNIVYAVIGIAFLFAVTVPLHIYVLFEKTDTPLPLLLTLPAVAGAVYISFRYKKPLLAISAILSAYTLFLGGALHIVIRIIGQDLSEIHAEMFPLMPRLVLYLTAMIVAGILYVLFCAVPHHRFYTSAGEFLLFLIFAFWSYLFVVEFPENTIPSYHLMSVFGSFFFLFVTLFQAMRTDLYNVRERSVTQVPVSISVFRSIYGVLWPVFPLTYLSDIEPLQRAVPLMVLICVCFACIFHAISIDAGGNPFRTGQSGSKQTLSRTIVFLTAVVASIIGFIMLCSYIPADVRNVKVLNILIHILPFLIPAAIFYAGARSKRNAPKLSPVLNLCGMYAATLCFTFFMALFSQYNVADSLGISYVYFHPAFALSLTALVVAVYFLFRLNREQPVCSGLIWVATLCPALFLCRAFDTEVGANAIIAVAVGVSILIVAWILDRSYRPVALVMIGLFAFHYLDYVEMLGDIYAIPEWGQVLLSQIPVVLFLVAALLLRLRIQDPEERNPFLSYALLFQLIVFVSVPLLTVAESRKMQEGLEKIGEWDRIRESSSLINIIFETVFYYFDRSFFLPLALPGFLLVGLCYYFSDDDSELRRRVLALGAVLLSMLVAMRFPDTFSIAEYIGQLHLIWPTLLVILLPFLIPSVKTADGKAIIPVSHAQTQYVYCIFCIALLGLAALGNDSLVNLMFYAIPAFGILLAAYLTKKDNYLKVGIVAVIALVIYMIRKIWGDKAWWIYFGITGVTLIIIGIRNEMKKRFK